MFEYHSDLYIPAYVRVYVCVHINMYVCVYVYACMGTSILSLYTRDGMIL